MEMETQESNQKDVALIHEFFKHYRAGGIAFSATLISVSSGLLVWLTSILESEKGTRDLDLIWVQVILLAAVIVSGLCIQFFHYLGYKYLARSYSGQSDRKISDTWFSREDYSVVMAVVFFAAQLIFLGVFYVTRF